MRSYYIMAALGALSLAGNALGAQTAEPIKQAFSFAFDDDRPRLGISTRSSGRRDTLGLLVSDVSRGSPAEKAGIEEGDRLASVNGVNLRLSRDDAEDETMGGVATRRLARELAKHKAGDTVELRVYRDGQTRTVRAALANPEDIHDVEGTFRSAQSLRTALNDRAVIGISLGGMGSRRDTLGVLVVGVTDSGPAALAGIDEGDRIAAVNGVDLRVDREDAGDWESSNARVRRLNRAMEKVKPGDDVELRVYSQGQTRTVRARAARAGDLRGHEGFFFNGGTIIGGDGVRMLRMPMAAPRPLLPSMKVQPRIYYSNPRASVELQTKVRAQALIQDAVERASLRAREPEIRTEALRHAEDVVRRKLEVRLQYLRSRIDLDDDAAASTAPAAPSAPLARAAPTPSRIAAASVAPDPARVMVSTAAPRFWAPPGTSAGVRGAFGATRLSSDPAAAAPPSTYDDGSIAVGGLRLTPVDADLASYLGDGTERGLLVVQQSSRWPGVKEGDVLLAIDGRPVRRADGTTSMAVREVAHSVLDLVRGGKRISVTIER